MNDVGDGAVPLHLQFAEPLLQPLVEPVEVSLGLGNQPVEALDRLPLDLAIEQVGELPVLAIDQRVERDLHVPADRLDLVLTLARHLGQNGCNACSSRIRSTSLRSGQWPFSGTGVPAGAGTMPSRKIVGCRALIAPPVPISITNSRRWRVLPWPSLTEAAKASSWAGWLR